MAYINAGYSFLYSDKTYNNNSHYLVREGTYQTRLSGSPLSIKILNHKLYTLGMYLEDSQTISKVLNDFPMSNA